MNKSRSALVVAVLTVAVSVTACTSTTAPEQSAAAAEQKSVPVPDGARQMLAALAHVKADIEKGDGA